ncbi:hypothetical protein Cob_v009582 [Colletotrichum orbiculare MAFF 240422]|uniref:Uncharacterized protein n=1 Tax=Colletotrichum orbiculare (strain 104-T / ATCC 96160 / CBS 514.97 / LARS 414 / MAFF 240422) TaxID=1213857 RepID=A0A484FHC3_COLOR|nr:hypothetical protein Cob_v009582 [Colletotrichum orbiculare MAFF 240422]
MWLLMVDPSSAGMAWQSFTTGSAPRPGHSLLTEPFTSPPPNPKGLRRESTLCDICFLDLPVDAAPKDQGFRWPEAAAAGT